MSEFDIGADGPICERCGGATEMVDCDECAGEGVSHHDCGEDTCVCLDKSDNVECAICEGAGFWNRCIKSIERCLEDAEDAERARLAP